MDITQKISLYDILAMIVPGLLLMSLGGIITIGLRPLLLLFHKGSVIEFTAFLTIAYIVGLIWNAIMEVAFNGLRNNRKMIRLLKSKKLREMCRIKASFLTLKRGFFEVSRGLKFWKKWHDYANCEYYRCYYFAMKNGYSNHISILEGQVAFLRNMIFVVLFYGVFFFCTANDSYILCTGLFMIAVSLFMPVLMIFKQQKIYKCVFEDFQYLSELNNKRILIMTETQLSTINKNR